MRARGDTCKRRMYAAGWRGCASPVAVACEMCEKHDFDVQEEVCPIKCAREAYVAPRESLVVARNRQSSASAHWKWHRDQSSSSCSSLRRTRFKSRCRWAPGLLRHSAPRAPCLRRKLQTRRKTAASRCLPCRSCLGCPNGSAARRRTTLASSLLRPSSRGVFRPPRSVPLRSSSFQRVLSRTGRARCRLLWLRPLG